MGDMVNQEQVVGDSLNLRGRKWPLAGQGMQRPTERNRSRCRRNVYPEHAIALAVDATNKLTKIVDHLSATLPEDMHTRSRQASNVLALCEETGHSNKVTRHHIAHMLQQR